VPGKKTPEIIYLTPLLPLLDNRGRIFIWVELPEGTDADFLWWEQVRMSFLLVRKAKRMGIKFKGA
jgi:hypothetical protein